MSADKLTPREIKFCKAYAKDLTNNATKAALAAGYAPNSARQSGNKLLQKDYIRQQIADIRRPVAQKIEEEFNYTAIESFKNLCKAQELALRQKKYYPGTGEEREKPDLTAFIKAEELKARLANLFEAETNRPQDITLHIKSSADIKAEREDKNDL